MRRTRRQFLRAGATLAAGGALAGFGGCDAGAAAAADAALEARLRAILGPDLQPGLIAKAYSELEPEATASVGRLLAALRSDLGWFSRYASVEELRERVRLAVERQYRTRETVSVYGWVLSRTEVRLAALVALPATVAVDAPKSGKSRWD